MIFNVSGGGGTALNFRVVGGTTAPSNPKENMIWVNTSAPITDWVFSATQPTAASGRVWISTGTSSPREFNALKKNGIQVYPISAKQYVSGAWVDVTAKSYQSGEWVGWIIYLYNAGDECTDITGGWERKAYASTNGSVTLDANKITIKGDVNYGSVCAGLKDFDPNIISVYKTIRCIVTSTPLISNSSVRIGIVLDYNLGNSGLDSKWISSAEVRTSATQVEISADISNVSKGYPMISAFQNTAQFEKIWLE